MRERRKTLTIRHMNDATRKDIKIKLLKTSNRETILKAAREKWHRMYRRTKIKMRVGFLLETIEM